MSTLRLAPWLLVAFLLSGILQSLVLRHCVRRWGWWILATVCGWLGAALVAAGAISAIESTLGGQGSFARAVVYALAAGPYFGAFVGGSQTLVLRRSIARAYRWTIASAAGMAIGLLPYIVVWLVNNLGLVRLALGVVLAAIVAAVALFGPLYGVITGWAMTRLLDEREVQA